MLCLKLSPSVHSAIVLCLGLLSEHNHLIGIPVSWASPGSQVYVLVIKESVPEHQIIGHTKIQQAHGHARGTQGISLQSKFPQAAMPLLWVLRTNLGIDNTGKCVPCCHYINCTSKLNREGIPSAVPDIHWWVHKHKSHKGLSI